MNLCKQRVLFKVFRAKLKTLYRKNKQVTPIFARGLEGSRPFTYTPRSLYVSA